MNPNWHAIHAFCSDKALNLDAAIHTECPTEPIQLNQSQIGLFELFVVIEARTRVDEQSSSNILRENSITRYLYAMQVTNFLGVVKLHLAFLTKRCLI